MANNRVSLGCEQTRGAFRLAGKVTGTLSQNFYTDGMSRNGKPWRKLHFGVETEPGKVVYVDLFGAAQDNCYISKTTNVGGKNLTDTVSIPWADRMDYWKKNPKLKDYRMIGITCGVERRIDPKTGKEVNNVKHLHAYDACDEIAKLNDGDDVFLRGNITYSTYNGQHRVNFEPVQVSLCRPIDFDAADFEPTAFFEQNIVLMGVTKSETPGEAIISAKIVNYSTIEDTELYTKNMRLANALNRLKRKEYVFITVYGDIVVETGVQPVTEESDFGGPNPMRRVSSMGVRKLMVSGAEEESIDYEAYSEEVIEHAMEVAANLQRAKDDYGDESDFGSKPKKRDNFIMQEEDDEIDFGN